MTDIPNVGFNREALEKELNRFGQAYGLGQNSRPSMFMRCVEAAHKLANVGEQDAEDLYTKFQQGVSRSRGIEYVAEKSFKVQISKLRVGLKLGSLPKIDGVDVITRAADEITRMSNMAESPLKGSAYDNLVNIGRRQLEQPNIALTNDEIIAALTPSVNEKTDLDKIIDSYKGLKRLADTLAGNGNDVSHIDAAAEELATQIKEMDGELPPATKAERDRAKALQTLKDQGFDVSNVSPLTTAPVEVAEQDEQEVA